MPALEDCYCPRCSRYKPSSQVVHNTKAIHRKEFGAATVERPFSSQFLNEFGSGTSSVHQTDTRPTSDGSEDDNSWSSSNDTRAVTQMDPRSSDSDSVNITFLSFVICAYYFYPNYFQSSEDDDVLGNIDPVSTGHSNTELLSFAHDLPNAIFEYCFEFIFKLL